MIRLGTDVLRSRAGSFIPIVAAAAVLAVLPQVWFGDSTYTTGLVVNALVFAAYGIGFNLIFGSTNQLFLCVGALAAVGGYSAALLSDSASLPIGLGILVGTVGAALLGGLLSWIAVRRSLGVIFTGVLTLVFSLAFGDFLLGQGNLTGGETGHVLKSAAVRLSDSRLGGYYLFAGVVVAFLCIFRVLQLSRAGWAFRALRDDETAAELAGVNVTRYRIVAAMIGSGMIGLTGGLFAYSDGYISPATYAFDQVDVRVLVIVAFGGLGTLLGPVVGAAAFGYLDHALVNSGQLQEFLYGLFIVAIFLAFRRGFAHTLVSLGRRLTRRRRDEVRPAAPAAPGPD